MTKKPIRWASILFTMILALSLAACSGQANQNESESDATAADLETVEIMNMDETLVFTEAPTRAVTLNQHATEVMLALGLESSMVGTAYLDDDILPEWKAIYDTIPVLADKYPSQEVFFAASPDFAYAGWQSAFTDKTLGARSDLAKQGVLTYVQESSNKPKPDLEDVYKDILNIGQIFRVEARAQALVDEINASLEEIQSRIGEIEEPLDIFVYDSGDEKAFTAANTYLTSLINKVGGKNIFDDVEKGWTEVSWEEVVARNPDVILIVDYSDTSAQQKRELLLSKTALSDIPAIQNERFITMPLSAAAEGVRASIALETLAKGLYPERME